MLPGMELMGCQGLAVPAQVMHHVVRVESSFNPYAIGVVGGRLARQPKNLPEALSTVRMLESRGYNFSLGLAQVNRYNLQKYGLGSYEHAFEPCSNLVAGSQILAECYRRSSADWGKSFSCYYSGNFTTGFRHGYVQKIYASMRQGRDVEVLPSISAIEVVSRQSRRTLPVSRYPLYADNVTGVASAPVATAANAASTSTEKLPAVSRVQQIPSRVVVDSPVAAVDRQSYVQPVPSATASQSAPTQLVASVVAAQPEMPRNQVALAVSPAPVIVAPASVQPVPAQESSTPATRSRGSRDPALVGGQVPERDGAFVF